jgi:hypothetical protein
MPTMALILYNFNILRTFYAYNLKHKVVVNFFTQSPGKYKLRSEDPTEDCYVAVLAGWPYHTTQEVVIRNI